MNLWLGDDVVVSEQFEHGGPTWGLGQRSFAMSPDGGSVAFTRNVAGFGQLCIVEIGTKTVRELGRGVHGQLSWAGGRIVALRTDDESRHLGPVDRQVDPLALCDPQRALARYPHELSGGMRQRVAIAAALIMRPQVLIADEPTTALDVTMEAQILHLFRDLRAEFDGAIIIVTHHLGVIAELCDRVAVMYAGEVVEVGTVDAIFHDPRHPYTRALLSCDPAVVDPSSGRLPTIGGRIPDLANPPPGCAFAPRCPLALPQCATPVPRMSPAGGREVLCHRGDA